MEKVGIGLDGQSAPTLGDGEKLTCRICCDEYRGKEAFSLPCNHFFCRGCWGGYLSAKVRTEKGRNEGGNGRGEGEDVLCWMYGIFFALFFPGVFLFFVVEL